MSLARAVRAAWTGLAAPSARRVSTSRPARGLEDFFDTPLKEGEAPVSGEALWTHW